MGAETFEIIIQITAVPLLSVVIIFFFNVEMYQTESFREWNILLIPEQVMQVNRGTCSGGTSSWVRGKFNALAVLLCHSKKLSYTGLSLYFVAGI